MATTAPPPGWHLDPSDPSGSTYRWWDGTQWTAHTNPGAGFATFAGPTYAVPSYPPQPHPAWGQPSPDPQWPANNGFVQQSSTRRNQGSLTAMAVSALYVVIAMTAHIVFFGIVPVMMTIRAFQRKEQMAPVALVFTVVAVAFALFVRH